MKTVIDVHNLIKRFGAFTAVDGVSLAVGEGEIFGLLGPNGAGKTTLMRLIAGVLGADAGTGRVLGYDLTQQVDQLKRHYGYVSQHFGLYPELTVEENLDFYSRIYGAQNDSVNRSVLEKYDLFPYRHRYAGQLSGGYKRRLSIACALTHSPRLLLLDEPTAGIDPVTRKELWDIFFELRGQGNSLFVTTHYMEEAERCDRLAFISEGRLVALGSPEEIKGGLNGMKVYAFDHRHNQSLTASLASQPPIRMLNQFGHELRIIVDQNMQIEELADMIRSGGESADNLHETAPTLEDVFITLTRDGGSG